MKTDYNKLKEGNKVKCIKNFFGNTNNTLYYEKDNYYVITKIERNTFEIASKYDIPIYFNSYEKSDYYINDYFININEERKQKLEKLKYEHIHE